MAPRRRQSTSSSSSSSEDESDRELQEAFAKGVLKPGLNRVIERSSKVYPNNVADMKSKLAELVLKLPWIERLDSVDDPAPMAPDVALHLKQTTQRELNIMSNDAKKPKVDINDNPVLNDFKRESLFHRQAQATVVRAIKQLHSLGIVTKRPDIYFAEMAKSDVHMQKVRQNLMAKQAGQAKAEKVRQLRQQKKMGKQLQAQTKQQRALEKKATMDQLKKYRKGAQNNDDLPDRSKSKGAIRKNKKDEKFGFGGKKKGSKRNTRDSTQDFSDLNRKKGKSNFIRKGGNMKGKNKRPGKSRRVNFKSKNKK